MQYDLFNEVSILERLGDSCASKLLDYGINEESIVLVQQRYKASLSAWRQKQPEDPGNQLRLYLNIFSATVQAIQVSKQALRLSWLEQCL